MKGSRAMLVPDWDDKYSVHNIRIDKQHQKLFEIAKHAANLIHKQVDSNEIKGVLLELFEYMKVHFRDEEMYMESIGYPRLAEHHENHKDIINQVTDLVQNVKYDFKQKLAIITRDWLVDHIMKEDMRIEQWYHDYKESQALDGDIDANIKMEQKSEIAHFYKCDCRKSFRVLETVHQKILGGQTYHCKKCRAQIVFVKDAPL